MTPLLDFKMAAAGEREEIEDDLPLPLPVPVPISECGEENPAKSNSRPRRPVRRLTPSDREWPAVMKGILCGILRQES